MEGNIELYQIIAAGGTPTLGVGLMIWQISRMKATIEGLTKGLKDQEERLTKRIITDEELYERRNSDIHSRLDDYQREERQHCQTCNQGILSRLEAAIARFTLGN